VMFLHGGFWRAKFDRHHAADLCEGFAAEGYVVANIEYRRVGNGGGFPATFLDVALALDVLPNLITARAPGRADLDRIAYVGHSAGGHLALWAALCDRLPAGSPGKLVAPPRIAGVVALAPVADLSAAYRENLGAGAVSELLGGGPGEYPDRYAATDPALLGAPAATILVHGDQDDRVPISIARAYCAETGATLTELAGIGHFELIDPASSAWPRVVAAVHRHLG
jgi:acetyl esterase/lipase